MKGKRLFVNTVIMTLVSLFLRSVGLWFQVALSRRMGAAGIGLMQLILSVGSLAATFAISGIRFAATRLVSEEMGRGRLGGVSGVVRRCLAYAAVFGCAASGLLLLLADTVAVRFLGDVRTALALRVLAVGMPFISTGAVLGGYFTGMCKAGRALMGTVSEELCRVAVALAALSFVRTANPELACAAVAAGSASGEIFSFLVLLALYLFDRGRRGGGEAPGGGVTRRMLGIAMPLALTAYARVALNTVQNMLIPSGLRKSGASAEAALAGYGMIQGMVFPVMTFPMVIFSSLSELIVPELTEEQVQGNSRRIEAAANALLMLTFAFSAAVAAYLWCFSDGLGRCIYQSAEAGRYIGLLALLMPVMYMDHITDGLLRGLGEQLYCMRVNIIDSVVSTALIYFALPVWGLYGYMAILYASEIFNFTLSVRRLARLTALGGSIRGMALTGLSALAAAGLTRLAMALSGGANGLLGLICGGAVFIAVYITLITLLRAVDRAELAGMLRDMR